MSTKPSFCSRCGTKLVGTEQKKSVGFDPYSGVERFETTRRLRCPKWSGFWHPHWLGIVHVSGMWYNRSDG